MNQKKSHVDINRESDIFLYLINPTEEEIEEENKEILNLENITNTFISLALVYCKPEDTKEHKSDTL